MARVYLREKTYWYRRQRPECVADLDPRTFIHMSLRTDNLEVANAKAEQLTKDLDALWDAMIVENGGLVAVLEDQIKHLSRLKGWPPRTTEQIATGGLEDVVKRLESIVEGAQCVCAERFWK